MRYSRVLAWTVVAAALTISGASLQAEERWERHDHDDLYRQDIRRDQRELREDQARAARMRAEMARDRWRLRQDWREGRRFAAREQAWDLARDRRGYREQMRDLGRDRRDLNRDYRESWRGR